MPSLEIIILNNDKVFEPQLFPGMGSNGDTVTEVTEDTALLSIFILT